MKRIAIVEIDAEGNASEIMPLGDFAAAIVDESGREFVNSFVDGMASVTFVITKSGFKKKADAMFDEIETRLKKRTSGIIDKIVQGARDAKKR